MVVIAAGVDYLDEIERVLAIYWNLPDLIDLQLRPEGLVLHTSDFPKIVYETTGLDLRQYFIDCVSGFCLNNAALEQQLAADFLQVMSTVQSFSSGTGGARIERSNDLVIELPRQLSHGFVHNLLVNKVVTFRLQSDGPEQVSFVDIEGVALDVCGAPVQLSELRIVARNGRCTITPKLMRTPVKPLPGKAALRSFNNSVRGLIFDLASRSGMINASMPIVHDEFRQYLKDALAFRRLLQEPRKDLLMIVERTMNISLNEPIARSLLSQAMRIVKQQEKITVGRTRDGACDLGGIILNLAATIDLELDRNLKELNINNLEGIGVEVPIDPPVELRAIGVDVSKSLPKKIISLNLGARNDHGVRRFVVHTAPGCWIAIDLDMHTMQPVADDSGNWIVVGVTNNPISGAPQKFFLRFDSEYRLNMTSEEIAQIVTQTAFEGFDLLDPSTWTWGAVALGGHALIAAADIARVARGDKDAVKTSARKFGRFIGKFFREI